MKKVLTLIFVVVLFFSCSKNYFIESTDVGSDFNPNKSYKTFVLPVELDVDNNALRKSSYSHLFVLLGKLSKNFQLIDKSTIEKILRTRGFGGQSNISVDKAQKIAKEKEADVLVATEISTKTADSKKSFPYLVYMRFIDVNSGSIIYQGRARAANPQSVQAGVELAMDMAIQGLLDKLK